MEIQVLRSFVRNGNLQRLFRFFEIVVRRGQRGRAELDRARRNAGSSLLSGENLMFVSFVPVQLNLT